MVWADLRRCLRPVSSQVFFSSAFSASAVVVVVVALYTQSRALFHRISLFGGDVIAASV